ncbi:DNA polymerase delta, subunit 4-domain-containing protein [Xylaria bambusicola]|uniref:DNA polymerase delta, subunit 4-domain-containing protein n=1 Tax=Xylaria bambusicola TaxID=326684 RepID=UPI0020075912|nr:DNA polymerase delta, subunit 4-domain-containing protein [Xylaria bambusicola]KAI0518156.1 DNA polymerase delta, subunit 4-domain-containing protein [Xylaria bambusicola]
MPATRRSTGGGRPTGKQATLSFNHRVTKSVPKSAKNLSSAHAQSPLAKHVINVEPDVKDEVDAEEKAEVEEPKQVEVAPEREKTEAELRADEISDRQISQYWRDIENERRTKRLHQEDLSLAEKILRYWDVSSQYGPCVGITRLKRWHRADRLGLNPPVEVLAVLMREEEEGTKGIEKAYMDNILNSTTNGGA